MAEALYQMYNLKLRLDIKHTVDGGKAAINEADAPSGGTVVFFNKPFKDVDSITVTSEGAINLNPIYNFVDAPNPVSFKVILYTSAGGHASGTISWKARGKL